MLYPDFNELIALKDRKVKFKSFSPRLIKSTLSGSGYSPFRGQGLEFDAVREYVPGDDIRNIDWRVTARTGSPHLKLFKEEKEKVIMICVDVNASMRFGTRNTFKSIQAARTAAFLGWHGISQNHRVSTCLFGDIPNGIQFFSADRGRTSFCEALKALSQAPNHFHSISADQIFLSIEKSVQTGSLIYFISDFMDFDQITLNEGVISRLCKRCDWIFITVNDPADQVIPPIGILDFHKNIDKKISIDTDSRTGRKAYEEQWLKNREKLYHLTSKFKIPLIELSTESDISKELSISLKSISKWNKR